MMIGNTIQPVYKFKTKLKTLATYFALMNVVLLTGCSSLTDHPVNQPTVIAQQSDSVKPTSTEVEAAPLHTSSGMTAGVMAQILTAELLVQKGLPAKAYELLYPLAEQTRDPALVERAFELSMATYQEAEILKATQLWLEVEPSQPTPWRAAYLMSLRQGELDVAIEQWNQYRKLADTDISEDVLSTAQRVVRSAKADVAMAFFDVVVSQNKTIWQSYYGYGVLATHYNQPQKAVEVLQQSLGLLNQSNSEALTKQKAKQQIYHLLSQAYLKFADPREGLNVLKDYLKTHSEDWLVQERVARLEVKAGYLKDAELRYQLILQANPEANTSRLSLALLQIELEKFAEARTHLLQVAQDVNYETVGFYYLGVLSQEQNRLSDAVAFFNKVEGQPYAVDAKLHIAEIIYPDKGLAAAITILDSIEISEAVIQAKVFRAKAIFYRASGQSQQAVNMYSEALTLLPGSVDLLLAQAGLYYDLQDFPGYVQNLEKVLVINPDSVDALNALGYYYVEQGVSLDKATILLERALSLEPESYYILDSIGWLAYQKQDYKTAEIYLSKALAIEHDAEVLIHLIATRWKMGKTESAKVLWQKHLAEFKNNKRYQMLIQNLQSGAVIK